MTEGKPDKLEDDAIAPTLQTTQEKRRPGITVPDRP